MVQPVLYDAQTFGERDLIDVDPIEFDDGHAHRHELSRVALEGLVADEKVDVDGGARAVAVGIRAECADQRVANPSLSKSILDTSRTARSKAGTGPSAA